MSFSSMLMALTWEGGRGGEIILQAQQRRQPGRALISCYRLAFAGSLRQSIQLLHIRAGDESASGVLKGKKQEGKREKE